jgi:uncharacterized membrane protein
MARSKAQLTLVRGAAQAAPRSSAILFFVCWIIPLAGLLGARSISAGLASLAWLAIGTVVIALVEARHEKKEAK